MSDRVKDNRRRILPGNLLISQPGRTVAGLDILMPLLSIVLLFYYLFASHLI
jgi:hypothetical protein